MTKFHYPIEELAVPDAEEIVQPHVPGAICRVPLSKTQDQHFHV